MMPQPGNPPCLSALTAKDTAQLCACIFSTPPNPSIPLKTQKTDFLLRGEVYLVYAYIKVTVSVAIQDSTRIVDVWGVL